MIRLALVGLGKMGLSHLAIARSHPDVELVAVCDSAKYVLDVMQKYIGLQTYSDYEKLLEEQKLDAVIISTPSRFHGPMVRTALEQGLHVFCEKPFCLDLKEGEQLAQLAASKGLVNQVGYHYRFVGAFTEARRLVDAGMLGRIHYVRAEAYGPVVLREKGVTWRTRKSEGGGCLYDYACHAIDTLNFLLGPVEHVSGTVLNRVFSEDVDDEVYATLHFQRGANGQLAANWSDESFRKMSLKISLWGTLGRMTVDRQEVQLYAREPLAAANVKAGWSSSYTTDLTDAVWYYLRGEEYSAQIDHFIRCVGSGQIETASPFASAVITDRILAMMQEDAARHLDVKPTSLPLRSPPKGRSLFGRAAALLNRGDTR